MRPPEVTRAPGGMPSHALEISPRLAQNRTAPPSDTSARIREMVPGRVPTYSPARSAPPRMPNHVSRVAFQNPQTRSVTLENRSAKDFQEALLLKLGKRCVPIENLGSSFRDRSLACYRVPLADGTSLEVVIDHDEHRVTISGQGAGVAAFAHLVHLMDLPKSDADERTELVVYQQENARSVEKAVQLLDEKQQQRVAAQRAAAMAREPPRNGEERSADDPRNDAGRLRLNGEVVEPGASGTGVLGPVQIEMLDELDVLVIRGNRDDVAEVLALIRQIESMSLEHEPEIAVYPLLYADSERVGELVGQLYEEVFLVRQGSVSITSLVKPNAILLIGRRDSVETVKDMIRKLDRPVDPETQFQVFRLRHAPVDAVREEIEEFYEDRQGLGAEVRVTSDFRSNSLIVEACPRDMLEVTSMIRRLDTGESEAMNEIKMIPLKNALAEELAPVLQEAMTGSGAQGQTAERSAMLSFAKVDTEGKKLLKSGILDDVRVTADPRSNALLVSAPPASMPLIEALVARLDQLPAAESEIKVFTIVNSDASSLADMLQTLFSETNQSDMPSVRTGALPEESSLVPMRFAVDVRTNSIIASGSSGDLNVVEAILLRLDQSDLQNRRVTVYRLLNAPAEMIAEAINNYLEDERQVEDTTEGVVSPFELLRREVVVVPEEVSNSLIVSTTPRYYNQIQKIVEELDQRPPMVMIQVLIAEVMLDDVDEMGVELGLQDSILFDRSLLDNLITTTTTTSQPGQPQVVTQTIQSANMVPGFLFNDVNNSLGNNGGTVQRAGATTVGSQGVSNFATGRMNSELGFGGFVFSASSESVSVLIRALQQDQKMNILSRPQVMTLDNQPAFIQVGERVPRITGTQTNEAGQQNNITLENVGLILGVTPRISPDGLVVMDVDAEKSSLGSEADGIPVAVQNGVTIRSPVINTVTAQTTISASSGQTVVLGGLITKETVDVSRRLPWVSDIPILGHLFRYDYHSCEESELLIILTPHIIRNEAELEMVKQMEIRRMQWCLSDVIQLNGDPTLRSRNDEWFDAETQVVQPGRPSDTSVLPPEQKIADQMPPAPKKKFPRLMKPFSSTKKPKDTPR